MEYNLFIEIRDKCKEYIPELQRTAKVIKLNPEKSGNIFDMHFRRDWENTSDEAELIMIAKSSKKGFMTGIKAGFVMWILTFMSMFAFDTGVMPIVAVGLVLIVMYVAYCREFVRLQK